MYRLNTFTKKILALGVSVLTLAGSYRVFNASEHLQNTEKIFNRGLFFFPNKNEYMSIEKNEKGNIIKKGMIINNKKHGQWMYVYDKYTIYEDYVNGVVDGEHKVLDENNTLICYGEVKMNHMISQKLYDSESMCVNLPKHGDFITYKIVTMDKGKSCVDVLIILHVESSAARVTPYRTHLLTYDFDKTGNIGRVEYATVKEIIDADGNNLQNATSIVFGNFYKVGQVLKDNSFDNNPNHFYSGGIDVGLTDKRINNFLKNYGSH